MIIGIDFDNTLICYDELFWECARELQLIHETCPRNKTAIRSHVRALTADGEGAWQRLQALAYGPMINRATVAPGVEEFLDKCLRQGIALTVVSHKSSYASAAPPPKGVDLRQAAKSWLATSGLCRFFPSNGIYFEPTRAAKVQRIGKLQCHAFIDDLTETFAEVGFPEATEALWYNPHCLPATHQCKVAIRSFSSWTHIGSYLLGGDSMPGGSLQ